jgi:hypothetical protein
MADFARPKHLPASKAKESNCFIDSPERDLEKNLIYNRDELLKLVNTITTKDVDNLVCAVGAKKTSSVLFYMRACIKNEAISKTEANVSLLENHAADELLKNLAVAKNKYDEHIGNMVYSGCNTNYYALKLVNGKTIHSGEPGFNQTVREYMNKALTAPIPKRAAALSNMVSSYSHAGADCFETF